MQYITISGLEGKLSYGFCWTQFASIRKTWKLFMKQETTRAQGAQDENTIFKGEKVDASFMAFGWSRTFRHCIGSRVRVIWSVTGVHCSLAWTIRHMTSLVSKHTLRLVCQVHHTNGIMAFCYWIKYNWPERNIYARTHGLDNVQMARSTARVACTYQCTAAMGMKMTLLQFIHQ